MTHQIRLPETLASTKQLITSCTADNKILGKVDTSDTIKPANERLASCMIDSRNDRRYKIRAESSLVQTRADEVRQRLGGDVSFFTEAVHVDLVAEQIGNGGYVGCEARETEIGGWCVVEDLGEVVGDRQGLHTESEIAGDCDAVFSHHGHTGTAIYFVSLGS